MMVRRTAEDTRRLLIRAGMRMLLAQGPSAGVQHIRLQDVLRTVGLSSGAAYRLWPDQDSYQRDLAIAMVELRFNEPVASSREAVAQVIASGRSLDEVIAAAAEAHVRRAALRRAEAGQGDAQAFLISLALRATAHTWPELTEASCRRHAESVEEFAEFYQQLLDTYGCRMKSPYRVRDFAEAMAALGEGFALHGLQGIEHRSYEFSEDDEAPSGRWTLFALSIRGLISEFIVRGDRDPVTS